MEKCIIYDEDVCGQYKPHNKQEEIISFEELATVNNSYGKYPELNESFLTK